MTMQPAPRYSSRRGSSLLLVLWAIMLMSFAVMGLVKHLSEGLDESLYDEKVFQSRLMLQSARVLAAHPAIERGDPLLRQQVSAVKSYEIILTNEGIHLGINALATGWRYRSVVRRLFESWGLDPRAAQSLADAITDWVDSDNEPRRQGAEREYYAAQGRPDFPFNRPFDNLDDLLLVRGFTEVDRLQPDWRNWFTLFGDGSVDVHLAPLELLAVLFDVTPGELSRFETARLGPDGLRDTVDDPRFPTLKFVRTLLDVPARNYEEVAGLLTLDHPVKRTECISRAGQLERRLTILAGPGINMIREE